MTRINMKNIRPSWTIALLSFALFMSPSQGAFAEVITADETGNLLEESILEIVSPVDCESDSGDIVAWDLSNGATTSDHGRLINDLQAKGYTVRTVDISTAGIPSCVKKLVITTQKFNACLTTPYSDTEVELIKTAVNNGLGLFLLNEWGSYCGSGTAPIAEALDATWNGNNNASQVFSSGTNFDPNNPATLFAGVNSWQQFAGSDYTATQGVVVTTNSNSPAMIAKPFGEGCVVIAGDSNWIADNWIGYDNNQTLASNVPDFLSECVQEKDECDLKPVMDALEVVESKLDGDIPQQLETLARMLAGLLRAVDALESKSDAMEVKLDDIQGKVSEEIAKAGKERAALESKSDAMEVKLDEIQGKLSKGMVVTQESLAAGQGGVWFPGARKGPSPRP